MKGTIHFAMLLAGAGITALATPASAAQELQDQPPVETAASSTALGDIVVTAQKRSENLQKVPIVISAVSSEDLEAAGITSLTSLNMAVPGFNSRNTSGAFQPSIRGIGTSSNVVENPVALYIDGIYIPQQREGLRELPDVEQIAVLKGPQGTLFGRNATGGVIQITTKRPTQELQVQARASFDNYETLRLGGFVSGGLADGIAGSLSVNYAHQGKGWGKNLYTGDGTFQLMHDFSVRGKLVADISPDTSVTIIGDYMDRLERGYSHVPYPGTNYVRPPVETGGLFDYYSHVNNHTGFKGGGGSLEIEHHFDFATLTSITSYRQGSSRYVFDDIPIGRKTLYVIVEPGGQPNKNFTQEIQLASSPDSPITWTVGAYYYYNMLKNQPIIRDFSPLFFNGSPPPPAASISKTYGAERTESFAPFGQVTIPLTAETNLTLGGRWTYEKRSMIDSRVEATLFTGA